MFRSPVIFRSLFRAIQPVRSYSIPASKGFKQIPGFKSANGVFGSHAISKRWLSTEMKESIEGAILAAPVVLFMKGTPEAPACGFSRSTITLLGTIGVDPEKFAAYNVLEDNELRQGIKEFSDWPTIPQLYINGEFIGGCDIITSMAQSGELLKTLEKDGLLAYEEDEVDVEGPSKSDVKPVKR